MFLSISITVWIFLYQLPSPSLILCSVLEAHLLRLAINRAQLIFFPSLPLALPDDGIWITPDTGLDNVGPSVTFLLIVVDKLMFFLPTFLVI